MFFIYFIFEKKITRNKRVEHNTNVVMYSVLWAVLTILLIIYLTLHIKYKFLIDVEYIIQNCLCYITNYNADDRIMMDFITEWAGNNPGSSSNDYSTNFSIKDFIDYFLNFKKEYYYNEKLLKYMYRETIIIKWIFYFLFIYAYNTLFVKGPLTWSKYLYFEDNVVSKKILAFKVFNHEINSQFVFWLFVITEILLFVTLFWVLLQSQTLPSNFLGNKWPPEKIPIMDPFSIPLLNTFLLISSGLTLMWVHHLKRNKKDKD